MKRKSISMTDLRTSRESYEKKGNFLKIADRISLGYGLLLLALIIYGIALVLNTLAGF